MPTLTAHEKISTILGTLVPHSVLHDSLLRGKAQLHKAKVFKSKNQTTDAAKAFTDACDSFEQVARLRQELRQPLVARVQRFESRHPSVAVVASSARYQSSSAPGQLERRRVLNEKAPEMWSSRILLRKNEAATEPYDIECSGHAFGVNPRVFSPAVFPDTYFFAANLPVSTNERFLEVGSGTGMIAALAAIRGASFVLATDINPSAVENTAQNFVRHNLTDRTEVRLGDVFTPVRSEEIFDTIWWNAPFMHCDKRDLSPLEMALYDPGYEALERYLSGAAQHLAVGGHVLIGFSTTHGHMEVLEDLAARYGWSLRLLAEQGVELPPSEQGASRFAVQLFEAVLKGPEGPVESTCAPSAAS